MTFMFRSPETHLSTFEGGKRKLNVGIWNNLDKMIMIASTSTPVYAHHDSDAIVYQKCMRLILTFA